ncbi:MAG: hypothetical protein M9894_13790 [Planctomycetes bacterium]|nr:hypothetical protein [Planctomycetota bacterium]
MSRPVTLRLAPLLAAPLVIAAGAWAAGAWWVARAQDPAGGPVTPAAPQAPTTPRGRVVLKGPEGPPRVDTGRGDAHGRPVRVDCGSCHATRPPDVTRREAADAAGFHHGLTYAHGGQSCLSCHDASNYDRLRLADGTPLPFTGVIQLCSQCHGTQRRDFEHGAHGGMRGHWDLAVGDRERQGCTSCHDPHAPAYPTVTPVFPPKDAYRVRGRAHD